MRWLKTWDFDKWADRYDVAVARESRVHARYAEVLERVVEVARIGPECWFWTSAPVRAI
jgi:L-lactate utilization protein LutC